MMYTTDSKKAYLYAGKGNNLAKSTPSVIRLTKPIQKSNRNVTADNMFSSVELIEELHSKALSHCHLLMVSRRIRLFSQTFQEEILVSDLFQPEIIAFHNMAKGGVDALEEKHFNQKDLKMAHGDLYIILDVSALNYHVLFKTFKNNPPVEKNIL